MCFTVSWRILFLPFLLRIILRVSKRAFGFTIKYSRRDANVFLREFHRSVHFPVSIYISLCTRGYIYVLNIRSSDIRVALVVWGVTALAATSLEGRDDELTYERLNIATRSLVSIWFSTLYTVYNPFALIIRSLSPFCFCFLCPNIQKDNNILPRLRCSRMSRNFVQVSFAWNFKILQKWLTRS